MVVGFDFFAFGWLIGWLVGWLVAGGWWLMVGGWWLVGGVWWCLVVGELLVVGCGLLVVGCWLFVVWLVWWWWLLLLLVCLRLLLLVCDTIHLVFASCFSFLLFRRRSENFGRGTIPAGSFFVTHCVEAEKDVLAVGKIPFRSGKILEM